MLRLTCPAKIKRYCWIGSLGPWCWERKNDTSCKRWRGVYSQHQRQHQLHVRRPFKATISQLTRRLKNQKKKKKSPLKLVRTQFISQIYSFLKRKISETIFSCYIKSIEPMLTKSKRDDSSMTTFKLSGQPLDLNYPRTPKDDKKSTQRKVL